MRILLSILVLASGLCSAVPTNAQIMTESTEVILVNHANGNCNKNDCYGGGGCAACVNLKIYLPPDAVIRGDPRCFTTAGGEKGDVPIRALGHCTDDAGWSTFHPPTVTKTSWCVIVQTTYHNRSADRLRWTKMEVDYELPAKHTKSPK
jgi:hypothetical protein